MNLFNKTLTFFNHIEQNKKLEIIKGEKYLQPKELRERIINRIINNIHEDYNVILEKGLIDYIISLRSKICWKNVAGNFIYGGYTTNGLWESLALKSEFWKIDFSLAPDAIVPEELLHFEKLNWFDKQAWGDDWRYGCFIREKGVFPPQIAFFDKNWYTPVALSLDEYFDAMFASCAVCGWQYFYIDYNQELPHLKKALDDMGNAVKQLPILFPDMNFTFHADKLKELKKIKDL